MSDWTSYLSDIRNSDPARAGRIEAGLRRWLASDGSWRKQVDNLCNDPHLPLTARLDLMKLFDGTYSEATKLLDAYSIKCREHLLEGPEYCDFPPDKLLWNSVSEKTLMDRLDKHFGSIIATRIISNFQKKEIDEITSRPIMASLGISPYNMWGTWKENTGGYPFEPWFHADHARARLGLSELDRHLPLYVIGYEFSGGLAANVPTVADAGNFPYFKPNTLGKPGSGTPGYTDPWHPKTDLLDNNGDEFKPSPCPEVVHTPAMISQIREVACLPA